MIILGLDSESDRIVVYVGGEPVGNDAFDDDTENLRPFGCRRPNALSGGVGNRGLVDNVSVLSGVRGRVDGALAERDVGDEECTDRRPRVVAPGVGKSGKYELVNELARRMPGTPAESPNGRGCPETDRVSRRGKATEGEDKPSCELTTRDCA